MPYLNQQVKKTLENVVVQLQMTVLDNPGKLNYLFTEIIKRYVACQGESYQTYNDIIGAIECCGYELYRRKVGPYENKKISSNGDVWENKNDVP